MCRRFVCSILFVLLIVTAPVQADLVHHWTLDEDTNAGATTVADSVGGKDGTINGATSDVGVLGNALYFDGVGTVEVTDFDTAGLKRMTMSFWMNPDVGYTATGGYKRVISANDGWEVILQPNSGLLGNNLYRKGGDYVQSTVAPPEGEWTHVAMTADLSPPGTGLMEVYLNGEFDAAMENQVLDDWSGGSFLMGYRASGGGEHYEGFLDDVQIYNEVLTAEGVKDAMAGIAPPPINVATVAELEAAAAAASAGDTIALAAGSYVITSQIALASGVTYMGAGEGLTIIDGNSLTRAFTAWGDRAATNGQVDDDGNAIPNLTGPTDWVIEGMTIQNCVSEAANRQDILSAARDLLNNYVADAAYTLETASAENGGVSANPEWFDILSGGADDDLTDVELQAYLDANPVGSAGHLVVNDEMQTKGGAIIMLNGAKGTIRNCTILNSSSVNDGGAIHARLSPLNAAGDPGVSLEGITVDGCIAGDDGGGIGIDSTGNDADSVPVVMIDGTVVTNCRAGGEAPDDGNRDGGGIHLNNFLNVTITNTLVDACTAGRHGAGIMIDNRVFDGLIDGLQVSNCSNDIIDGEGGDGAALSIDTDASIVRIANSIFSNNVNNQDDGIVRIDAHEGMIVNCSFVGNVTGDQGIIRWATGEDDASVQNGVVNCLFVNNDASPGSDQVIAHNKGNVTYTYTNNAFFGNILDDGDSLIDSTADEDLGLTFNLVLMVDPLVDTAGGDYHLVAGSEAIDAGTAEGAPDDDIEGNARPQGDAPDIGAYEAPVN
jgi:hypothetical protein